MINEATQETVDGSNQACMEMCEGYGSVPAQLLFVGISAGRLGALQTKVPFTKDASGRLFQRCLWYLNLSRTNVETTTEPELINCYVTNLVKGRILDADGLNRLPTDKEVQFWWAKFLMEVGQVRPEMIIALGDFVYQKIMERWPIVELWAGSHNVRIVKARHPRYYASHGALKHRSKAFNQMVHDYRFLIWEAKERE